MTASYPPVLGGLQTATHTLARFLAQQHEVRVIAQQYPRSLPATELLDDVPVQRMLFLRPELGYLSRGRLDLAIASLYFYPSTLIRLARLVRTFRPDVVNVHFPDSQIPFVLWLRRRFGFRLVVSLHGNEIERWFKAETGLPAQQPAAINREQEPGIRQLRALLQQADTVTACSYYLLDKAARLEPSVASKARVIYNGIEPGRFRDTTPYRHPRPYILAVGRLTYKKGFDMLLEAFRACASPCDEVDLILAGEGEERPALQKQIQRLGLEARVHLIGRVSPEELVKLLNGCLFVAVPSREEPFGIVALEALVAGRPILATRVGGLVEFVSGPGTWLVDPGVSAIQQGLIHLLEQAPIQVESLSDRAVDRFSWRRSIAQFERAYCGEATE
ncbi:MAG: glycosyltransferase family 4 protein [Kouleothrix sp.]|nr:glycosyltransferase family 4 protein [Kouleothrix sp.]